MEVSVGGCVFSLFLYEMLVALFNLMVVAFTLCQINCTNVDGLLYFCFVAVIVRIYPMEVLFVCSKVCWIVFYMVLYGKVFS